MKGICWLLLIATSAMAQVDSLESLQVKLETANTAEERIDALNQLAHFYSQLSLETAEQFANEALDAATRIDYYKGIASSYNNLGICYSIRGKYPEGLEYFFKGLRIREGLQDLRGVSHSFTNISRVYIYQRDFEKALEYASKAHELLKKINDPRAEGNTLISLGSIYMSKNDVPAALAMFTKARDLFIVNGFKTQEAWALLQLGNALKKQGSYDEALANCFTAITLIKDKKDVFTSIELYQAIGQIYAIKKDLKNAQQYLQQAIHLADEGHDGNGKMSSRLMLAEVFESFGKYDSALYYKDAYLKLYVEIFNTEKSKQLATLEKVYQTEKKDQELMLKNQQIRSQSIIISIISVLLVVLVLLGFYIYRYSRDKKKSNIELRRLNRDIHEKHEEILTQAEELTQANAEITRINESLEREVSLRTEKIEKQNKMLIDYAYSNAHNVRGPLARILGLAALMSTENDPARLREYNTYIHVSAQELDKVIGEINVKLQEGN